MVHFEISVALNHDVDDLLVGIVAEIKESIVALKHTLSATLNAAVDENADASILVRLLLVLLLLL